MDLSVNAPKTGLLPRAWITAFVLLFAAAGAVPAQGPDLDSLQRVVDSLREIEQRKAELEQQKRELEEIADELDEYADQDDSEYDTLVTIRQSRGGGTIKITHSPEDIVQMGGDVEVDASTRVKGDAVALGGNLTVYGIVRGDAVAIGGNVYLNEGSRVHGDAVSIGGRVVRERDAIVDGAVVAPIPFGSGVLPWMHEREKSLAERVGGVLRSSFIGYLLIFFLILIFVDLFGGATDRACTYVAHDVVKSGLAGFLTLLLTPVIIGVLAVTVIGLPVIPIYLLALLVVFFWGMVVVSLEAGRVWGTRLMPSLSHARWLALAGAVLLTLPKYAGKFIAAIGGPLQIVGWSLSVVGSVILFVAICVGMGSLILSRLGRRSIGWTGQGDAGDPVGPAGTGSADLRDVSDDPDDPDAVPAPRD